MKGDREKRKKKRNWKGREMEDVRKKRCLSCWNLLSNNRLEPGLSKQTVAISAHSNSQKSRLAGFRSSNIAVPITLQAAARF